MASLHSTFMQVEKSDGTPESGALLYFYQVGTTTEITVYQDSAETTPHANPVVADASGIFSPIWVASSTYKTVLKTSAGVTILTTDDIIGSTEASGTFDDDEFIIQDETDTTKKAQFQASGITANTTRTYTFPDASGTLVLSASGNAEYIPSGAFIPQITNGPAAGVTQLSTNLQPLASLDYDQTTEESAVFLWAPPFERAVATMTFKVFWTAASGSGGVAWSLEAVAVSNDDALNPAYGTAVTVTDTLITANDQHTTAESASVTVGGTPAIADLYWLRVKRVVGNAADTLAADAKFLGIKIYYALT